MSQLTQGAEKAYGSGFVTKSAQVAGRLGISNDCLLAIISMETTGFKANGPPWKGRNAKDNGGGLIGFTGNDGGAWETKTPTQQLDDVEQYFRSRMTKLDITNLCSPVEAYLMVRGPLAVLMGPQGNMGDHKTKQWVVDAIKAFFNRNGVTWTLPTVGIEGQWNVRIGDWLGQFVFNSEGSVWRSDAPRRAVGSVGPGGSLSAAAEPEVDYSARTYGHWEKIGGKIRWRFWPPDDIRRFEVDWTGAAQKLDGSILPAGQGFFKMWKGSVEPS